MKVVITGSAGFIMGYVVEELLRQGHSVIGIDNYSKYGPVEKSYDSHPNYTFFEHDAKDVEFVSNLLQDADHFIHGAAMIGGISYFHKFAYDLIAENERIMAAGFDAAISAYQKKRLKKITVMSSSMIHESTTKWPSKEGDEYKIPPPLSTYGFQKLATHYFAKGAWEQYQLPYTIVVPFNCIGTGEMRAKTDIEIESGNVKLAMSHVVPDLVQKILKGQNPVHILGEGNQIRHYTYGGDLAKGIVMTLENPRAMNESFNLAIEKGHSVLELLDAIWKKLKPGEELRGVVSDDPFEYDVQKRVPDITKARDILGFEATTTLEDSLDEIVPWIQEMMEKGKI